MFYSPTITKKVKYSELENIEVDHFKCIRSICSGAYGQVYLVRLDPAKIIGNQIFDIDTLLPYLQRRFVFKVFLKTKYSIKLFDPHKEYEILSTFDHPSIVKVFAEYETKERVFILMEYISGGDFFDVMADYYPTGFPEKVAAKYIKDLLNALYYCHQKGIIHGDIKLENLLLNKMNDKLKLCDFGYADYIDKIENARKGTVIYMAPEVLKGLEYTTLSEVWSLGVLLYEMLKGVIPYNIKNTEKILEDMENINANIMALNISDLAKDMISCCLNLDPSKRFSVNQLLCHPWIKLNT